MVGKTKRNGETTDEEALTVIRKFKLGVEELAKIKGMTEDFQQELGVYESYLPLMMSEQTLSDTIDYYVKELEERSPKQMGKIMAKLKERHMGTYDGALASKLVKEKLS